MATFVVKNGNAQFYTRAGNFYLDDAGTLVTSDGSKVQAYKMDSNGNATNNYGDVAVNVNAVYAGRNFFKDSFYRKFVFRFIQV